MSKVKVWGKEVSCCRDCEYLEEALDGCENIYRYCNKGKYYLDDVDVLDKDCPFTKPITKEVIESFGGEVAYIPEAYKEDILFWFNNKKYLVHIHNHDRIIPLLISTYFIG